MDLVVYLSEIRIVTIPGVWAVNRGEVWATFILVVVAGLVLLSFMGVLVGAWFDHAVSGLFHTLAAPLIVYR